MTDIALVIAAYEPCGCLAAVSVLDSDPARAYEMAAAEARAGNRIETLDIEAWRARRWRCPDHPQGPPWWKSNGGNGRRPATYEPQTTLGLP